MVLITVSCQLLFREFRSQITTFDYILILNYGLTLIVFVGLAWPVRIKAKAFWSNARISVRKACGGLGIRTSLPRPYAYRFKHNKIFLFFDYFLWNPY